MNEFKRMNQKGLRIHLIYKIGTNIELLQKPRSPKRTGNPNGQKKKKKKLNLLMSKGDNNPNGKRMNLTKKKRQHKQQTKQLHNRTNHQVVESTNLDIVPLEQVLVQSTINHRNSLLLTNKPHNDESKIKLHSIIRPARMGKHGMLIRATRVNKKKVKKLLTPKIKQSILKQVSECDVEMQ